MLTVRAARTDDLGAIVKLDDVGLHLARLEMRILIDALLDRLDSVELAGEPKALRHFYAVGFEDRAKAEWSAIDRAMRVGRGLQAGIIGVNTGLVSNAANPFGGVKQSGYGREGSVYGVEDYLQVKSLTLALG